MQVTVTCRHFEADETIKNYAREKVFKLKKYLDRPVEAHVVLSVEKFRNTAEVTITGDRYTINGMEKTDDMLSAIDKVVDKLDCQIKKHHEKTRRKKNNSQLQDRWYRMDILASEPSGEGQAARIIQSNEFSAKPMSLEEATLQLDATKNEFLVFTNSDSGAINVVYRRKDGHYGLIAPESE
jgi:putative sigma-54 modulation protein